MTSAISNKSRCHVRFPIVRFPIVLKRTLWQVSHSARYFSQVFFPRDVGARICYLLRSLETPNDCGNPAVFIAAHGNYFYELISQKKKGISHMLI
jgi:hypothetical protein